MFDNPFINRNADTDSIDEIVNYWCDPSYISTREILLSKKALFYEGPRGCGKTTIFKYYSYQGQQSLGKTLRTLTDENNYICIYYKMKEYNYTAFCGKGLDNIIWRNIFSHVFEIKLALLTIELIFNYNKEYELVNGICIDKVANLNFKEKRILTLKDLRDELTKALEYVNEFVRKRSLVNVDFIPNIWFEPYSIITPLVDCVNATLNKQSFNIAFLLDEVENITYEQQKVINTYVKYVTTNITFRIGLRPAGFITKETLSNEAIRENHDFTLIEIQNLINNEKYTEFVKNIANKRLDNFYKQNCMPVKLNIESLLGLREDLDVEIDEKIPNTFNKHFELLNRSISKKEIESIKSTSKLQELLNIIKINRGETPDNVNKQMQFFNDKVNTENYEYKKYCNDYQNKYKKSLTHLLLHIANKDKYYYSLRTYAYLSSGSTRFFLQLCYSVFKIASFKNGDDLFNNRKISMKIQNEAAIEVANSEINYLKSVAPFGDNIFNFIDNMCKLFKYYHNDKEMKYPETNQFIIKNLDLDLLNAEIMRVARQHSFIIRKTRMQRGTIGKPKTYIYTINRIYYPLYNISYVTRGGFNPTLTNEVISQLFNSQKEKGIDVFRLLYPSKFIKKSNDSDAMQIGIEDLL